MPFKRTPVIQAAAILVGLVTGALPTSARAQGTTPESFRAIVARTQIQPGQLKQLLPSTEATRHQTVRNPPTHRPRRSSNYRMAQRIATAVGMGLAGFWVGGKVGATLEGNCTCDDPGLKGFMIGAPIGAVTGVTLGIVLTR